MPLAVGPAMVSAVASFGLSKLLGPGDTFSESKKFQREFAEEQRLANLDTQVSQALYVHFDRLNRLKPWVVRRKREEYIRWYSAFYSERLDPSLPSGTGFIRDYDQRERYLSRAPTQSELYADAFESLQRELGINITNPHRTFAGFQPLIDGLDYVYRQSKEDEFYDNYEDAKERIDEEFE